MKKVQGKIPVVSLLSKLLTPEGGIGVEALSYNEYCRAKLDAAGGTEYGASLSEICDAYKKEPRQLLLLTWMVYEGDGLLPDDVATAAARRLSSTGFDYEYEIFKFESARDEAIAARAEKRRRPARGAGRGEGDEDGDGGVGAVLRRDERVDDGGEGAHRRRRRGDHGGGMT